MSADSSTFDPEGGDDPAQPTSRLDPDLAFDDPLLIEVLDYWYEIRAARRMPRRRDLDPVRLPRRAMALVALTDILREPRLRFRWRLLGTGITHRMGRDVTGRYWDDLYDGGTLDWFSSGPRWLMEHRRPLRLISSVPIADRGFQVMESVELPFSDEDDEQVTMIMAVVSFP